jgi:hypothetical protein
MDWNRLLSLTLACVYVAVALFWVSSRRSADAVGILLITLVLACIAVAMIWYGEDWGGRSLGLSRLGIDRGTPGGGVKLVGWLILLLPILAGFGLWLGR